MAIKCSAASFKQFLLEYCEKHSVPIEKDGPLPFRLQFRTFTEADLKGECIGVALQYLKAIFCPNLLDLALTQQAVNLLLQSDLSSCMKNAPQEDGEKSYDASSIAHLVLSYLHSVCVEWNEQLPDSLAAAEMPPTYSECGIRNTRRKMEDQHIIFTNLNHLLELKDLPVVQFYAVYDGHGGLDASYYASKQLHLQFVEQECFTENIAEALKKSIKQADENFCLKAQNERLRSGTTAVVAVIFQQVLHLAWVGDSQAVLVRDGKPLTMMNPHKPEREDEKKRIEEMGGCVVWFGAWRVNGSLAVSRAIGDADHKPYVSGDADTTSVPLDGSEDYLCLACDGFWDVLSPHDLVRLVQDYVRDASNDRAGLSRHLCMKAKEAGSTDNITVVVVFLREDINLDATASEQTDDPTAKTEDTSGQIPPKQSDSNANDNANNNNGRSDNDDDNNNNNNHNNHVQADGLTLIKGQHMQPEEKAKVPNKILANYVRNLHQKELDKGLAIVTESSSHSKLPHSLNKPRWASPNVSPATVRRDTKQSILSLSKVESSITELLPYPQKTIRSVSEFPQIDDAAKAGTLQRHSVAGLREKGLGHRAVRKTGQPRVAYPASLVSCQPVRNYTRSSPHQAKKKGYSRSIPGDLSHIDPPEVRRSLETDIVITNSLAATLKPLKHKTRVSQSNGRNVVKLSERGRQRSKSAF